MKKEEIRTKVLRVRMSDKEREAVEKKAKKYDKNASEYVRMLIEKDKQEVNYE